MFKKLKDKLAEEVKSSPQRIQQFAQAAQAAVTSASSSISDITNSDLFSIADNDNQQSRDVNTQLSENVQPNTFHNISHTISDLAPDTMNYSSSHDIVENQRQRRLSNSSFASDVSFRLPSYETPSMYHLQSDMEVSASEADERGFSSGSVSLDRVTKEQIYSAYRRTQDRYKKYRTQYGDLARHYKFLEKENAKARSVLVETQDKALRRISELKEQCSLEQSAKAHIEKALRVEIEDKDTKINVLNMKIKLLQDNTNNSNVTNIESTNPENQNEYKSASVTGTEDEVELINLSGDTETKQSKNESDELVILTNKIEKMEQLINKYKESHKASKDKKSQMTAELQILSHEIENKTKENQQLKAIADQFNESQLKVQELNELNEALQNKINAFDFAKTKELSTLEIDLQKAQETITQLQSKIDVFYKREEEYAISLAENKLSIHKELEEKETEIKSLTNSLSTAKKEIQSLNIVINEYKNSTKLLEETNAKHINEINELNLAKNNITEIESQLQELRKKYHSLEQSKTKGDEELKCLQLQLKQETAEKLAMIDRNDYLENRNSQLTEENAKKAAQVSTLDSQLKSYKKETHDQSTQNSEDQEKQQVLEELSMWKSKYEKFESEIQDERVELVKLQSEIEKLLENHELIQKQNTDYNVNLSILKSENMLLHKQVANYNKVKSVCKKMACKVKALNEILHITSEEAKSLKEVNKNMVTAIMENVNISLNHFIQSEIEKSNNKFNELEVKYNVLQTNLDDTNEQLAAKSNGLNSLQDHNNNLNETIQELELKNRLLTEKVNRIESDYNISLNELNTLNKDQQTMLLKMQECETKYQLLLSSRTKEIEDDIISKTQKEDYISVLTQENISLKDQVNILSQNVKILETEINEARNSHAEIKIKNDRLAELLENSKKNDCEKILVSHESSQTDRLDEFLENDKIIVKETTIVTNASNNKDEVYNDSNETVDNYITMKTEYSLLKDENRRLQSDIEGLQSYLTKISKENSDLNDKLRDSIASSVLSPEASDLGDLKNEVILGKEKIDALIRENTLLTEENFELKDQLQLQSYTQSNENKSRNGTGSENTAFNLKYNSLLEANSTLEKRLHDLEHINSTLNGNMQENYEKNEKLRSSNEKLERRLDEALVSLRHLHSLQENTELEYLKNILYEYLTGSGSHSVTLAKVLSAIVKFDDIQTQLVLQKEKERQGLLRQLGII